MNDRGMSDVCPGSALAARPQLAQREQSIIIIAIIVRLTLMRSLNALTIDDHRRLAVCTRVVYEVKSKRLRCVLLAFLSPSGLLWRSSSEIDRTDSMWTCMQAGKAAENRRRGVTQNRKEGRGRGIGGKGERAKEQVVRLATRSFVCSWYYCSAVVVLTTLLETTGPTKQHFFPPSQPTSHESSS